MDKQEISEEHKGQSLPAEVRSAQRRRAMQMSRARMMAAVPEADVDRHQPDALLRRAEVRRRHARADGRGQGPGPHGAQDPRDRRASTASRSSPTRRSPAALHASVEVGQADPRGVLPRRGAGPGLRLPHRRQESGRMTGALKKVMKYTDLIAAGLVVLVVVMLVVPLPPFLLDLFITLNISVALAIVITTLYLPRALDFSSFPSLLLLTTLFRLAINVSVTRLILLHGDAGDVVKAFGEFVVGGNVVVGLVIFLILIVIQFVVVTNGAGRVAEVGGALHPRRHAGQADGDRRRPQRRPDHRGGGAQAARRHRPRGRLLRRDGRRLEVRQGRRDRRGHHHGDQPHRRHRRRRHAAGDADRRGRPALLAADDRRRPRRRRSRRC